MGNEAFYAARDVVRAFCEKNRDLCQAIPRESRGPSGGEQMLIDIFADLAEGDFATFSRAVQTMKEYADVRDSRRMNIRPDKVLLHATCIEFLTDMEPRGVAIDSRRAI